MDMTGRSHLLIGTTVAACAVTATAAATTTAAIVVGAAMLTAKLPDADIKLGIRHRGITHTLVALVLCTVAVGVGLSFYGGTAAYAGAAAAGVLIGYGMHLVADACTPHGIPALWPLYRRDVHLLPRLLRITTGGIAETLVVLALLVTVVLLGVNAYG